MYYLANSSAQFTIPDSHLFVRRWGQSAVRVNDYVYLEGGTVSAYQNLDRRVQIMHDVDRTLSIPLSSSWTNQSVDIIQTLPGNRPWNYGSVLWPRSHGFYLYGGYNGTGTINTVWRFLADERGGGAWGRSNDPSAPVLSGLEDSSCSASNHVGFCYGGYSTSRSDYPMSRPSPRLISYNLTSKTWHNESTPDHESTTIWGAAETISDLGPEGLFVSLGGARRPNVLFNSDDIIYGDPVSMASISIYEPLSKKWYKQPTTGPTPPSRVGFCTTLAKSSTGSYELFVYGGGETSLTTGGRTFSYDDAYVLTMPGFNWFQVPQVDIESPGGRIQHTCTLVGNRQVLVVGGLNWSNDTAQYKSVDPWVQGIGIFDLSTLNWKGRYDADAPAYESPDVIRKWYQNGSLDRVEWVSNELRTLFQGTPPSPNPPSSNSPNVGAIAGGVVGAVLGLILVLLLLWAWRRRRRGLPVLSRGQREKSITGESGHNFEEKAELPASHSTPDLAHSEQDAKANPIGHQLFASDSNALLRSADPRHELE